MGSGGRGEEKEMRTGANCAKGQWGMPSKVGRGEGGWGRGGAVARNVGAETRCRREDCWLSLREESIKTFNNLHNFLVGKNIMIQT